MRVSKPLPARTAIAGHLALLSSTSPPEPLEEETAWY
jgi:hypothetical protein